MAGAIIGAIAATAFFVGLQLVLFRVLGKLAMNVTGLGSAGDTVYGLSDALSQLPAWTLQLMNWMYLDQSLLIITTALFFGAVVKLLGGQR